MARAADEREDQAVSASAGDNREADLAREARYRVPPLVIRHALN